jgi:hypothetical protein
MWLLTSSIAAGLIAATGAGLRATRKRYYRGPVSDHFDGERFFDRHGVPAKRFSDLLRWQRTRVTAVWPAWAPSGYSDTPPERVAGHEWRVAYVGHASLLLLSTHFRRSTPCSSHTATTTISTSSRCRASHASTDRA